MIICTSCGERNCRCFSDNEDLYAETEEIEDDLEYLRKTDNRLYMDGIYRIIQSAQYMKANNE